MFGSGWRYVVRRHRERRIVSGRLQCHAGMRPAGMALVIAREPVIVVLGLVDDGSGLMAEALFQQHKGRARRVNSIAIVALGVHVFGALIDRPRHGRVLSAPPPAQAAKREITAAFRALAHLADGRAVFIIEVFGGAGHHSQFIQTEKPTTNRAIAKPEAMLA